MGSFCYGFPQIPRNSNPSLYASKLGDQMYFILDSPFLASMTVTRSTRRTKKINGIYDQIL
jgi:hypothetical protein